MDVVSDDRMEVDGEEIQVRYGLSAVFRTGFQGALSGRFASRLDVIIPDVNAFRASGTESNNGSFGKEPAAVIDKVPPSLLELDHYANQRWESVLHFMVGRSSKEDPKSDVHLPEGILMLLHESGLMAKMCVLKYLACSFTIS